MKKTALVAAIVFAISTGSVHAASEKDAADAIAAAVNAVNAAAKVKGEWRDSKKFIDKANKAMKEGKYDEAVKWANKAKFEGEMGKQQAMDNKNARIPAYVYK